MPIQAQAADGSIHSFPDGTDPAVVDKVMKSYVAQSTQPPDDGSTSALHKLGVAASSLPRGFLSTLEMLGQGAASVSDRPHITPQSDDAFGQQLQQSIAGIGTPANQKNVAEKYINAGGEALGSLPLAGPLGPETSVARAATTSVLSGLGGQAGSDLTGNTWWGRLIGGLMGGGVPMAEKLLLHPNNAQSMAQRATSNIPNKDFEMQQAAGNQATAATQGIPQTTAQAFENAPGMAELQKTLVASGQAPKTVAVLNKQTGVATGKAADAISSLPGTQSAPLDVANQTQAAATQGIKDAQNAAGEAFRNTLKAAGGSTSLPDKAYGPFVRWLQTLKQANPNSNVAAMADDALGAISNPASKAPPPTAGSLLGPNGQPIAQQVAQSQPRYISDPLAAKQALDDSLSGFGPRRLNSDSVDANSSRAMAQIRQQFNAMLAKSSPAVAQANAAYEKVMTDTVNPMKEGYVGRVAGRTGAQEGVPAVNKITSILDAGTPPGTQVSPILTVARTMNKTDPTAFPTAVKSNLATKLAESTTTNSGQLDPKGLQKFYNAVYGNEALKQGLKEQLVGTAEAQGMSSNALYPGFLRLMDTLGRLSNRPESTAGVSAEQLAKMAGSNAVSNVYRLIFPRTQAGLVEGAYASSSYKQLDTMMSSSQGVKLLQTLSKNDPLGKVGQQAIIGYLGGTSPQNPPQTGPQN